MSKITLAKTGSVDSSSMIASRDRVVSGSASGYVPAFDGLRAIAVSIVMGDHGAYGHIPGGFLGVDLFFTLSGFLITGILLEEHDRTGSVSLKNFYGRRILRLYPALLIAVLLAGALWATVPPETVVRPWSRTVLPVLFYYANFVYTDLGSLGHTWSLAVEEQFYLIWPIVVVALFPRRGRWTVMAVSAALILLANVTRTVMEQRGATLQTLYALAPARMDALMVGALCAILVSEKCNWLRFVRGTFVVAFVVALLLVALPFLQYDTPWLYHGGFTLVAVASGALIMSVRAASSESLGKRLLSHRWSVWVGKRSYGVYLYHVPIFLALEHLRRAGSPLNFLAVSSLKIVATLIAAGLSYHFVELPFLKLKARFRDPLERSGAFAERTNAVTGVRGRPRPANFT